MTEVQTCDLDRKSTRLNSSHTIISYAVFCLKKTRRENWCPRGSLEVAGWQRRRRRQRPRHPSAPSHIQAASSAHPHVSSNYSFFFLNEREPPEIYPFPLPDALPI